MSQTPITTDHLLIEAEMLLKVSKRSWGATLRSLIGKETQEDALKKKLKPTLGENLLNIIDILKAFNAYRHPTLAAHDLNKSLLLFIDAINDYPFGNTKSQCLKFTNILLDFLKPYLAPLFLVLSLSRRGGNKLFLLQGQRGLEFIHTLENPMTSPFFNQIQQCSDNIFEVDNLNLGEIEFKAFCRDKLLLKQSSKTIKSIISTNYNISYMQVSMDEQPHLITLLHDMCNAFQPRPKLLQ